MAEPGPARLHAMLVALDGVGATAAGGVHRPACTAADGAARDLLQAWMRGAGMQVAIDAIGNMAGLLELAGPGAPVVMAGSHLDSQPQGGRFDGALGVAAACAAALDLQDQVRAGLLRPCCNVAVVNWTNEEGARFQPSLLGSGVYAGTLGLRDALACADGDGVRIGTALQDIGYAGTGVLPRAGAYVELHVECGRTLDDAGERLGVFTRYWGAVKQRVVFTGEAAHTGPTPMPLRRDALLGAARLVCAVRAMADAAPGLLHSSVGRIEVRPNSPNVVPAEAIAFVELRSPEPGVLTWAEAELTRQIEAAAEAAGLRADPGPVDRRPAGAFDAALAAMAGEEAAAVGHAVRPLDTVAGHDAVSMAGVCPSMMLVVPSVGGLCHNPAEFTHPADVALGAALMTRVLTRLCRDGIAA